MSSCRICGRPLSNPSSVAAGIGPVCGSRGYRNRISARFGSSLGGWSEIDEWQKVNNPCYSCKHFEFPPKGRESELPNGFRIEMRGQVKEFGKTSIGGYCRKLAKLVDGNLIKEEIECHGESFVKRKKEDEPEVGLLHMGNGQTELFKI